MKRARYICIGCMLLVIPIVMYIFVNIDIYRIYDADMYYYGNGAKINIIGKVTIETKDNQRYLHNEDTTVQLDSSPLYYNKDSRLLIAQDMMIVTHEEEVKSFRVNHNTEFYKNNQAFYIKDQSNEHKIEESFLYDGADTYIFLEEANMTIANQTIQLKPLSYIRCLANKVVLYSYENSTYSELPVEANTEIKAVFKDQSSLNLTYDIFTYRGTDILLVKDISLLSIYQ